MVDWSDEIKFILLKPKSNFEHWLKLGDKNSKFFHASATQRRRANMIKSIEDEDGNFFPGSK
jgi:hypothetical protein